MFHNLSFRYKIPLRGSVLIVLTAVIVTTSLSYRAYEDLRSDVLSGAESMSRVLVRTLVPALLHDDVWQVYEVINSPYAPPSRADALQAELIMVLDPAGRIFVSTQPRTYPMYTEVGQYGAGLELLWQRIAAHEAAEPLLLDLPEARHIYLVTPLISDGVRVGSLVMGYDSAMFMPRFSSIVKRAALITLLCLAVLLPVSWYWGVRMAKPLVQLAGCMGRVGSEIPEKMRCELYQSKDEIGQVGESFKRMLGELKEKEALERRLVMADRLAAIGRLTSAIAHEINNPLGGMLNAIDTQKRHGKPDPRTARTISLLERGLLQIRDTVAALLVDAKPEAHRLSAQDVEDIRTLVAPDAAKKAITLHWHNAIDAKTCLPSTPVRQTLINLLLNAIQAAHSGGRVECRVWKAGDTVHLEVINDGRTISAEQMAHLFEPFSPASERGHGLGLWVCYQIVQQLEGAIDVGSEAGVTRFHVTLPCGEAPR